VPRERIVVLGLVTSKGGELEAKDQLKRRIGEMSRFVDVDQLCLSPKRVLLHVRRQRLTREQQFDKLPLIVETAREV
jgi:5-methyltetrahydropteroyltriglutamate--homocysteine methyltransferase